MSLFLSSWLAQEASSLLCCHLQPVSLLCLICAAAAAPATVCLNSVLVLVPVVLDVPYSPFQPLPFYDSLNCSKAENPPGQWVPGVMCKNGGTGPEASLPLAGSAAREMVTWSLNRKSHRWQQLLLSKYAPLLCILVRSISLHSCMLYILFMEPTAGVLG